MIHHVSVDRTLIRKYDRSGPRYTSYPTAPHFNELFDAESFRDTIRQRQKRTPQRPLSLYLHIPFCDTVCYYCACNKVVTPDRSRAVIYLDYLLREIKQVGALFESRPPVLQLHLGGGTPTYLNCDQMRRLMDALREHFSLVEDDSGEYALEVDPREVPEGAPAAWRAMGFNRVSIGVQDFDPAVQKAVNRIQSEALTRRVVDECREAGFHSINLDLMYGLPLQTVKGFESTLQTVIHHLNPDRLAVFNYAHLPQYFSPQRRIHNEEIPSPETKLQILETTIESLESSGYLYIGMDHFARPDDEMTIAQRQGLLYRNFQGYTTHADCDLVAFGTTGISQVGETYAQNVRALDAYYQKIDAEELTVFRGLALSRDDIIRREVIMRLICDFTLDQAEIEQKFSIVFKDYFNQEMAGIARMVSEGLLERGDDHRDGATQVLRVTPGGRLLIRNICMIFDWYLRHAEQTKQFSRTI